MSNQLNQLRQQLQFAIDNKTKPPGSLGLLETIALQAGLIQQSLRPTVQDPQIVVFAGDHGIAKTGLVNPFPQEVTAQMVMNFLRGGAAINVFTRLHNIGLTVVDAGVNNEDWDEIFASDHFIDAKIARGTANYLESDAMSEAAVVAAIEAGRSIITNLALQGCNTIGFGEMGIGNTSSAALIMSAITGIPVENCVGRGTGVNDDQLKVKIETLQKVFQYHKLELCSNNPISLLGKVGGFEIAMMTGAFLAAAEHRMIIVVDGFITTAALLLAQQMETSVKEYCLFAHTSHEQGHEGMLRYLDAQPVLHLGMRLGEGTGAALAIPLIRSAVAFLNEMASFDTAGVSNATESTTSRPKA
ncbi:nicotinate-nucleotide--dimethylbenzimidazole phosphoribosyltransferase [Pseudoflavitalea rhizosphaerae]|uniref:nicotinate-nucleotide--dimethylbenzimidazole phosphoribosyltransferase n=1 Tax=Pseudoflavitalea rhizosphaerae TaxID=1884793 RepID=UPI000F8D4F9D|nr:nicotinate-nucleotide--dimethylbenzimidazole phosphoribosyltransferase [Pseudoflavitalea rhizosphaerae]